MRGEPVCKFTAPSDAGSCVCSFNLSASGTDVKFDNDMDGYTFIHDTKIDGFSVVINVDIKES